MGNCWSVGCGCRVQEGRHTRAGGQPRPPADERRAAPRRQPVEPLPEGLPAPGQLQRRRHPRQVPERDAHHHAPQEGSLAAARPARAHHGEVGTAGVQGVGAGGASGSCHFPEAARRAQAVAEGECRQW